ncbi:hypothetical protein ElyMa_006662400 [Elysia marginata]|uniref:MULE transposase domain-containing protein n=1 Tax=Elysia marginata TaxID=1093978 RepID=A0AAV4IPZ5_9GAST|nr:hypothetical protein ElyMa_006662400 [Elysia marginata]
MLHVNDTDSGIVIVTTRQNLEYLAIPEIQILSDGTFQYCPRFFLQMYTLVGYSNGQYIPLLPSKSRETYRRMFQHTSDIASSMDVDLQLKCLHMDFETAAHQGLKDVFSDATIKGCHFYLSQAWWRKIQSLGLSRVFKDKETIEARCLKYIFGIMFLPPHQIEEYFVFELMAEKSENEKMGELMDYLLETSAKQKTDYKLTDRRKTQNTGFSSLTSQG